MINAILAGMNIMLKSVVNAFNPYTGVKLNKVNLDLVDIIEIITLYFYIKVNLLTNFNTFYG